MKAIHMAEDIVPLADFKSRTSQLLRKLREDQRPLVITQNGKPAAVLITPEDFDRIREQQRFAEAVSAGLADSAAGRLFDDKELDAVLDKEFGQSK